MSDDAAHPLFTAYRPNRRTLLQAGSLALLLAGKQQIAFGASIMAVRVWPAEDYSRVTLESDVPLVAKQTLIQSPPRLAVDIEGLQLNSALKELVEQTRKKKRRAFYEDRLEALRRSAGKARAEMAQQQGSRQSVSSENVYG